MTRLVNRLAMVAFGLVVGRSPFTRYLTDSIMMGCPAVECPTSQRGLPRLATFSSLSRLKKSRSRPFPSFVRGLSVFPTFQRQAVVATPIETQILEER